jgi:toxin-antitoxin system PIN domain toxin
MTSLAFPDINVWLALTLRAHVHHQAAWKWYRSLASAEDLAFCRFTQLGLLRLLTTESVAKHETLNQRQAWAAYDRWIEQGGGVFREEPLGLETAFRSFADNSVPAPKEWADSYLAGFAAAASMELVTFDRALSLRAKRSILLKHSVT